MNIYCKMKTIFLQNFKHQIQVLFNSIKSINLLINYQIFLHVILIILMIKDLPLKNIVIKINAIVN